MPTSAPKPCTTCATLVTDGTSRCQAHKPLPWLIRRPEVKRTTGRKLQAQRAALFARSPWCVQCQEEGRRVLATIRDHRMPLAEGGTDEDNNIQALCRDCHDIKTASESARGRGVQKSAAPQRETDRKSVV